MKGGGIRLLTLLLLLPFGAMADDAAEWLARINNALGTVNYEGVFLQTSNGNVDPMKVIHRVENGKSIERLISLDGIGREIISDGEEVICIFPDTDTVLVETRSGHRPLMGSLPKFNDEVLNNYSVSVIKSDSVLGRNARVIDVMPGDSFRYGYRLWVDEQTGLPLISQVLDDTGATIEQVRFASIVFPESIPESAVKTDIDLTGFRWVRGESSDHDNAASVSEASWQVGSLPNGFSLSAYGTETQSQAAQPVVHMVYSDGLASVSVFVEKPAAEELPVGGLSRIGSSNAFSVLVGDHLVTAIGEVPPITVQAIASSVVNRSPDEK